MSKDFLREEVKRTIKFRPAGEEWLSRDGRKRFHWMINLRERLVERDFILAMCEEFWKIYADKWPFQIVGLEMAGALMVPPLVMTCPFKEGLNGCIVRKEKKVYSGKNSIDGTLNDYPIILVDDLLNSGWAISQAVQHSGLTYQEVFVLINFQHMSLFEPTTSLFNLREFRPYIRDQEKSRGLVV